MPFQEYLAHITNELIKLSVLSIQLWVWHLQTTKNDVWKIGFLILLYNWRIDIVNSTNTNITL